jgi:hypothetical protein
MTRRRVVLVLCSAVVALPAAPALAQTPVNGGYPSTLVPLPPVHRGEPSSQVSTARSVSPTKRLPFTGVDVRLLVLGGIGLLGVGYGLRRRTRPQRQ